LLDNADRKVPFFAIHRPGTLRHIGRGEQTNCIKKVEAVFGQVGAALGFVPLELQRRPPGVTAP
jgi:hypothetical protein